MSAWNRLSLHHRLLLGALLVAVLFLGLTGLALDQAFRSSLAQAERERLQNHVYTLLAAARVEDGALRVPGELPDRRFHQAGGGLYGRIRDAGGEVLWRSGSLGGLDWPRSETVGPGDLRFARLELNREPTRSLSYGLRWSDPDAGTREYTVEVAESRLDSREELGTFRRTLWGWLVAAGGGLLLTQGMLQHWGLRPLRRTIRELRDVRQGYKDALDAAEPAELAPLTDGINRLLQAERERRRQYQTSLADLAHSLKTPLAILRGKLEQTGDTAAGEALEQVERIDTTVRYHLARAGRSHERLGQRTPVRPVAERLLRALPGQRTPMPTMELDCPQDLAFPGPEDELMELLGNLLDNAVRHCHERVRLAAADTEDGAGLEIVIDDDGPGIPERERERVMRRGERADTRHQGQGIGLAIAAELITAYGGELAIATSPLGGTRISLRVPQPR